MMNWKLLAQLTVLLFFVPVASIVVFTYGWTNKPQSWTWIWCGTLAAVPLAFVRVLLEAITVNRLKKFLVRIVIHAMIFGLSAGVIIYGWGMQPQRWWVIIGGYLVAFMLPPFNQAPYLYTDNEGDKL